MRHLNAIPGFECVKPISETGSHSYTIVAGDYFRIENCIEKTDGTWEGTLIKYRKGSGGFIRSEERVSFTPPNLDPHALIQSEDWCHDDLRHYTAAIDDHVAQCTDCENRLKKSSGATLLPKLRAKITVKFPEPRNSQERMEQLQQLDRGQCLPCGCMVQDVGWTRQQAAAAFYKALAEIMQVPEGQISKVGGSIKLLDLPLTTKSLRRLRDKFWLPDGSLGSEEGRDKEEGETVRQLPATVGDFIARILSIHSGMFYTECSEHWAP